MKKNDDVFKYIEDSAELMINFLSSIVSVPAMGPLSGGNGEMEKAEAILKFLKDKNIGDISRHDADDERVSSGKRPNIEVVLKGKSSERRIVLITHIDVVPPGKISQWDTEPFKLKIDKGKLIGRGVEDNGQALTAAVFALKAMVDLNITPVYDISLFMVSDEEESNIKGIGHLLDKGLIDKNDLILVPDHGDPEGHIIETIEKTLLWVKITVKGKQCHASMPHLGNNALRASIQYSSLVDRLLHERFNLKDMLFDYPYSSFEPTKREIEMSGINVIPGEDVFYYDCRLLPEYSVEEVLSVMEETASEVEKQSGVKISVQPFLIEKTLNPTPPDAPIIIMLTKAIEDVTGVKPAIGGISGGTCATLIRNSGYSVAVWETIDNQAHAPNEYIKINNLIKDCKVFASLFNTKIAFRN